MLECSPGYVRKDDAAGIVASNSEACCQKTCSTFRCPHGHINKGRDIIGDSYDECCVKTCKAVQCPRGHTLIEDYNKVITVSSESCCEAYLCSLHVCLGLAPEAGGYCSQEPLRVYLLCFHL